ncbi:MAG: hypothetical protein ACYC97_05610 [Metallibacterium sp.]
MLTQISNEAMIDLESIVAIIVEAKKDNESWKTQKSFRVTIWLSGSISLTEYFTTEEEAKAWIKGKLNINF